MINGIWLTAATSYALESTLESLIIFAIVQAVLSFKRITDPAIACRFLMLPLVIPVLFSPALHLIFPQLDDFSLVAQLENSLPFVRHLRAVNVPFAEALLALFFLILIYNLIRVLAVSFREANARENKTNLRANLRRLLVGLADRLNTPLPTLIISTRKPNTAGTFGIRHPVITLGSQWLQRLDHEELESVLAHEIAHFKRGDPMLMLVTKTCRDLMFFNPLAHWVYNRVNELREQATDDLTLKATDNPLALASCLVKFLRWQQPVLDSACLGFATCASFLEKRIQRMLFARDNGQEVSSESSSNWVFYGLSIALTVMLSLV